MRKFIIALAIIAGSLFIAAPAQAYIPRDPTLHHDKVCVRYLVFEHGLHFVKKCHIHVYLA